MMTLTSTKAKVHDVNKVREVLESYAMEGGEMVLTSDDPGWSLEMSHHVGEFHSANSLGAVRFDDLPHEDDYADKDDYYDATAEVLRENGREGFLAMLRDVAPLLDTPLLILAVDTDDWGSDAQAYLADPHLKKVTMLCIGPPDAT